MRRQTLAIFEKLLRLEHPNTLTAYAALLTRLRTNVAMTNLFLYDIVHALYVVLSSEKIVQPLRHVTDTVPKCLLRKSSPGSKMLRIAWGA